MKLMYDDPNTVRLRLYLNQCQTLYKPQIASVSQFHHLDSHEPIAVRLSNVTKFVRGTRKQ